MPVQPKNQLDIYYRARMDGLTPSECVALAHHVRESLGIAEPSVMEIDFDFPSSTFHGSLDEASAIFPVGGDAELVNCATLNIGGQADSGPRSITVSAAPRDALVGITFSQFHALEVDPIIALIKRALPPMFPDADSEQQRVREVRVACEEIASHAASVNATLERVTEQATNVAQILAAAESDRGIVSALSAESTSLLAATTQSAAAVAAIHEEVKTANQDIADKQVKVTAVVNNATDFQQRIEASEQKARTTVDEVQSRSAAALAELQAKATTTVADAQAGANAAIEALRASSSQSVSEHTVRTDAIVAKNEELQRTVEVLLQGANAGELFKAFQARKAELEATQGKWLWALAGVTAAVVVGGGALVYALASTTTGDLGLIAIKVTVLLPLVVLDVFIANQYNNRRALIEECAFKAALSLSLIPYKDLVRDQTAEPAALQFVLASVEKIYANPSDAIARPGAAAKELKRAVKLVQESGVVDVVKVAADRAKP